MKVSQDLIDFIKGEEGFRDTAYKPISGDRWTVGYGFTYIAAIPVFEGETITEERAEEILSNLVQNTADQICKSKLPINISQNQFDAVVSLVYNIGIGNWNGSDTQKMFITGNNISDRFILWNKAEGKVVQGLTNRRLKEKAIYDSGDYTV